MLRSASHIFFNEYYNTKSIFRRFFNAQKIIIKVDQLVVFINFPVLLQTK